MHRLVQKAGPGILLHKIVYVGLIGTITLLHITSIPSSLLVNTIQDENN